MDTADSEGADFVPDRDEVVDVPHVLVVFWAEGDVALEDQLGPDWYW